MAADTYPMARLASGSGLATAEAVERVLAAAGLGTTQWANSPIGDKPGFSDVGRVRLAKRRRDVEDQDELDDEEEEEEGEEEDGLEEDEDEDEDFDEDDEEFEEEFEDDELDDDDDDIFYDDDDDE